VVDDQINKDIQEQIILEHLSNLSDTDSCKDEGVSHSSFGFQSLDKEVDKFHQAEPYTSHLDNDVSLASNNFQSLIKERFDLINCIG